MSLIEDVIKGHIENRIVELKAYYAGQQGARDEFVLHAAPIACQLNLSVSSIEQLMEELAVEGKLIKKWSYECTREKLPIKTTKRPIEKAYCHWCNKKHSKDRETLNESIDYWVKAEKDEKEKELIRG